MKGKNTLKLNTDMMLDAVQMWVDSAITSKPKVVGVRQIAPMGYGDTATPMYYEIDVASDVIDPSQKEAIKP